MAWSKEKGGGTCEPEQWAVLDDAGETEGCFETEAEADEQIAALYASSGEGEEPEADAALPERWAGVLIVEGIRTDDDREFDEGALTWRELPIPLMWQKEDSHGGMPTTVSVQVGLIDAIERVGQEIRGEGSFDLGSEDGKEAARRVGAGLLRHVSGDVGATEWEVYEEGDCADAGFLFFADDGTQAIEDDDEETNVLMDSACHIIERIKEGIMLAATLVPMPAFPQAEIAPLVAGANARLRAHPLPLVREDLDAMVAAARCAPCEDSVLVASTAPIAPPAEWFEDPQLDGPTPLTVTSDGRVFGHLAQWGVCHRGIADRCVLAPKTHSSYSGFHAGGHVDCADGSRVRVGQLTVGGDHPSGHLSADDALAHYADASTVWANARVGEDNHGIWIAGATLPDVDEFTLRRAKALALSGDWRPLVRGAPIELIAALSVPVPGFPISDALVAGGAEMVRGPRVTTDENGVILSLVAAGMLAPRDDSGGVLPEVMQRMAVFESRLAAAERVTRQLRPLAAERIREDALST